VPLLSLKSSALVGQFSPSAQASESGFYSIATQSAGSGGASYIEFTNIPQTYKHLQIRAVVFQGVRTNVSTMYFNGDTTASNYRYQVGYGDGGGSNGATATYDASYSPWAGGGTTSQPAAMILDIYDYTNTNKWKIYGCFDGTVTGDGDGSLALSGGRWESTSAITSIKFTPYATTYSQYTQFCLYGVK
jgi:hypothetical protein